MDLTDAPASMLPQIEAALRQLRGGLNLLRIGDMRRTGRVSVVPGGGAKEVQMLPWSSQWTRWGRIGPAPVAIAGEEVEVRQTTDYFQNATAALRAGVPYVAVVEASATVSAHVALSVAGAGVAAPLGVVFDALTGAVVSQYGPVNACGAAAAGGALAVLADLWRPSRRCVGPGLCAAAGPWIDPPQDAPPHPCHAGGRPSAGLCASGFCQCLG
ncbi:hypothetical protein [Comamonas sp. wu1-DMT]|uniref:hypothetical protein n=1 Tax=Comamonas sp. wu1-DMT TaxID=3126390 RepID=UPI0032E507F0